MDFYFEEPKEGQMDKLVVKDNQLMEGKFKFTLWELRIFEKMISLVDRKDTEFKRWRLGIKDLLTFFGQSASKDYGLIRQAAFGLAEKKIYIPYTDEKKQKRWAMMSIFPTVTVPATTNPKEGAESYIELQLHEDLKPFLLDIKTRFKSYEISNIQPLQSKYSIRMFILLKQYEKIGTREFSLEQLRDILGIDANEYLLYTDFKKAAILRAEEDLKKYCDIYFEFEELKEGKKTVAINFRIYKNINRLKIEINKKNIIEKKMVVVFHQDLFSIVEPWGISKETFRNYCVEFPKTHLEKRIAYVAGILSDKRKTVIQNVPAYFHSLLQLPDVAERVEITAQAEKITKEKVSPKSKLTEAERNKLVSELTEKIGALRNELFKEEELILEKLLSNSAEIRNTTFEQTKKLPMARFDYGLTEEENFSQNRMFRISVKIYVETHWASYFMAVRQQYQAKIQELEKKRLSL